MPAAVRINLLMQYFKITQALAIKVLHRTVAVFIKQDLDIGQSGFHDFMNGLVDCLWQCLFELADDQPCLLHNFPVIFRNGAGDEFERR